jgi:small subunit ribosomal protein S16
MAVHIRLARGGTKKKPFYRVVVTDQRSPRGGRFLENIGTFDPLLDVKNAKLADDKKIPSLILDNARLDYWRSQGATPSETLGRLLKKHAKAAAAAAAPAAKK